MGIIFLILFLFIPITFSLDYFPEEINVYTNKDYFEIKLMLYNNESLPVTIKYGNYIATIPPRNARLFRFNVSFGENLVFRVNGRPFTIPIKWNRGLDRQEPALTGITIPGKWGVVGKIESPKNPEEIELPKPKKEKKGIKINYYFLIPLVAIPIIYLLKKYFIF